MSDVQVGKMRPADLGRINTRASVSKIEQTPDKVFQDNDNKRTSIRTTVGNIYNGSGTAYASRSGEGALKGEVTQSGGILDKLASGHSEFPERISVWDQASGKSVEFSRSEVRQAIQDYIKANPDALNKIGNHSSQVDHQTFGTDNKHWFKNSAGQLNVKPGGIIDIPLVVVPGPDGKPMIGIETNTTNPTSKSPGSIEPRESRLTIQTDGKTGTAKPRIPDNFEQRTAAEPLRDYPNQDINVWDIGGGKPIWKYGDSGTPYRRVELQLKNGQSLKLWQFTVPGSDVPRYVDGSGKTLATYTDPKGKVHIELGNGEVHEIEDKFSVVYTNVSLMYGSSATYDEKRGSPFNPV